MLHPRQAAKIEITTVPRYRPSGITIVDRAKCIIAVCADQSACSIARCCYCSGIVSIADAAVARPCQSANKIFSRNTAVHQSDIADGAAVGRTEQADKVRTRQIDCQVSDRMSLPVEGAGEFAGAGTHGDEGTPRPDVRCCSRGGGIDVMSDRILSSQIHRHQLQLVRIVDGSRVFGSEHRPCGAERAGGVVEGPVDVHHHPIIAPGTGRRREIKACEIGGRLHLHRAQPDGPGRIRAGTDSHVISTAIPVTVCDNAERRIKFHQSRMRRSARSVTVGDRGGIESHQASERCITRGVTVSDDSAAFIRPYQPARVVTSGDVTRGIAVIDGAGPLVRADQAARIRDSGQVACGIGVVDSTAVISRQCTGTVGSRHTPPDQPDILN